jgi:hypothetical protein
VQVAVRRNFIGEVLAVASNRLLEGQDRCGFNTLAFRGSGDGLLAVPAVIRIEAKFIRHEQVAD